MKGNITILDETNPNKPVVKAVIKGDKPVKKALQADIDLQDILLAGGFCSLIAKVLRAGIDLQDMLLAGGFCSLIAGVAMIYVPAAFVLAGMLCLLFAFLIERSKGKRE
jgi:hypothetical protein